nr:hypothetical protein CFP56_55018 [Quercus suber]
MNETYAIASCRGSAPKPTSLGLYCRQMNTRFTRGIDLPRQRSGPSEVSPRAPTALYNTNYRFSTDVRKK